MAITVDDTTVARWSGQPNNNVDITSASFTPPDNSLLVVGISADTAADSAITLSVSGGSLTWNERAIRNGDEAGAGNGGCAAIWTAPVGTGASMSVSVRRTAGSGSTNTISAKCYIVTGQDASPIGDTAETNSTTANYTPAAETMVGAGRLFGTATEWNDGGGTPTSSDVEDAANETGVCAISAYKAADHTASSSQSINYQQSGSAIWTEVRVEILAATGGVQIGPAQAAAALAGQGLSLGFTINMPDEP
jgi:hypothetical protein